MDLKELHEKVLYPTCRVRLESSGGSGTIIYSEARKSKDPGDPNEYQTFVLTNHHVIADAVKAVEDWDSIIKKKVKKEVKSRVSVDIFDYIDLSRVVSTNTHMADIIAYDKNHDLALLKLDTPRKYPYVADLWPKDAEDEIKMFTEIFTCGASLLHEPFANPGHVTYLQEYIEEEIYWMCNASMIFGNCLPGESLVSMADGRVKRIDEVVEGDTVWSYGHSAGMSKHTVKRAINSGKKKILDIKTMGRTIRCSENHPLAKVESFSDWSGKKHNVVKWVPANEIVNGDTIACLDRLPERTTRKGINLFQLLGTQDNDNIKDFIWFCGYYLGDGWSRNRDGDGYEISVACYSDDPRSRLESIFENVFGYKPSFNSASEKGGTLSIYRKDAYEILVEAGLTGASRTKDIPDWVMSLPDNDMREFIDGYLTADGHLNKNQDMVFEAVNDTMIKKIRMLFIHLGVDVSNISTRTRDVEVNGCSYNTTTYAFSAYPNKTKSKNCYVGGDHSGLPADLVYKKVNSVEECEEEYVYDLEIEGVHNFFADGVLVHNSGGSVYTKEGGKFIGVPARVTVKQLGFGTDVVTWMGFFVPIPRIYRFLDEQEFQFLYDSNDSYEAGQKRRNKRQKRSMFELVKEDDDDALAVPSELFNQYGGVPEEE